MSCFRLRNVVNLALSLTIFGALATVSARAQSPDGTAFIPPNRPAKAMAEVPSSPAPFGVRDKLDELGFDRDGKPAGWETTATTATAAVRLAKAAEPPTQLCLHFAREGGGEVRVWRPLPTLTANATMRDRVRYVVAALVNGPLPSEAAKGAVSFFPVGTRLHDVLVSDAKDITVLLDLPEGALDDNERVMRLFNNAHEPMNHNLLNFDFRSLNLLVRKPGTTDYRPLDDFMEPVPETPIGPPDTATVNRSDADANPPTRNLNITPRIQQNRPSGALSGKAVYLNPGHGWTYRDSGFWGVQRTFVHNNLEDFSNLDLVNNYVAQYAWQAGADVFSVRELDPNPNMVIVDNDDGNNGTTGYFETGTAANFTTSSLAGFLNATFWDTGTNPFANGKTRLIACVIGAPTSSAEFVPNIPTAGWYNVYVSHGAFTNRSPEAHYRVFHAGGETDVSIDQRRWRYTWVLLGNFYFEGGANRAKQKVVLFNDSSSNTHYVSADAVRFGGGTSVIRRGGLFANKPRNEEEARYHMQYAGMTTTYDFSGDDESDGWTGRGRFAQFLYDQAIAYGAPAQDSLFMSSHTNAFDGTVRGLGTYVYTGNEGTWNDTLRNYVHDEVLADLQNGYGNGFANHGVGKRFGNYGENNPSNVGSAKMPVFLGEWIFHDNASDMALIHDPKFRQMHARAILQGFVKFWANRNSTPVNLLPEPPTNLRLTTLSPTSVKVDWNAPATDARGGDAPTGYKVYVSTHGRGFTTGIPISGGATLTHTLTNLAPNTTHYVYVTATNAGGESFGTPVLAARVTDAFSAPKVLVVYGFTKTDASTRFRSTYNSSLLYRQFPFRTNSQDYVVEHLRAIDAYSNSDRPIRVDGATAAAVAAGSVSLTGYQLVIYIAGIQAEVSTVDPTNDAAVPAAVQTAITNYLNAGGRLFISGSEIAWDIDRGGTTTWVDNVLKANYAADSGGTYTIAPATGGSLFAGLSNFTISDGSQWMYQVTFPDVLAAVGGSAVQLAYGSAGGTGAGISFNGAYRLVYLGFGFETIVNNATRNQVMKRVLDFMLQSPISTTKTETFSTITAFAAPGSTTGWSTFGFNTPNFAAPSVDPVTKSVLATVSTSPDKFRVAGAVVNRDEWMPIAAVGTTRAYRGRFFVYRTGQANPADTNQIPALRARLSQRFAVNSMLESFPHNDGDPGAAAAYAELAPTTDATNPSVYRVDLVPVVTPYSLTNQNVEGAQAAFEAFAQFPGDNGSLGLTEVALSGYEIAPLFTGSPAKAYEPTATDAGTLRVTNPVELTVANLVVPPGEGSFAQQETTGSIPTYAEGPSGIQFDSAAVPTDRIGLVSREFSPGTDSTEPDFVRITGDGLYAVRWTVSSTVNSNRNAQLRMRTRSVKFGFSNKYEIGGAQTTNGSANLSIAAEVLPGPGGQNPRNAPSISPTFGGYYLQVVHSPMNVDMRPQVAGDVAARFPVLSNAPGPGNSVRPSVRDFRIGLDLLDTLSGGANAPLETGNYTLHRTEVFELTLNRE